MYVRTTQLLLAPAFSNISNTQFQNSWNYVVNTKHHYYWNFFCQIVPLWRLNLKAQMSVELDSQHYHLQNKVVSMTIFNFQQVAFSFLHYLCLKWKKQCRQITHEEDVFEGSYVCRTHFRSSCTIFQSKSLTIFSF